MRVAAFPVEVTSGVPVVITPEEIDITNAGALRAALLRAGAQGRKTYVVDMTRTRFCDSAGLHALLGAHRRARAEGGEVRFVVTGPAVRRILAIMAIDRVIPSSAAWMRLSRPRPGPTCQDDQSGLSARNSRLRCSDHGGGRASSFGSIPVCGASIVLR